MNLDVVLALLQISMALGILYLALPEARYRDKLYGHIAEAFKAQDDLGGDHDEVSLLLRRRAFNETYHRVMMWREELPNEYDDELKDTPARLFPREAGRNPETANEDLPREYRTFKANTDVRWCFAIAEVLPILATWLLAGLEAGFSIPAYLEIPFDVPMSVEVIFHAGGYVTALTAQVSVGRFVWLGRRMVSKRTEQFKDCLSDVVSKVAAERAKKEVEPL